MIHVVYVVIYLRMLFIFFLNVDFINTIELLCLTVVVPISIEYILFGCNEISEDLNTLLLKSVQKFIRQTCRFNN